MSERPSGADALAARAALLDGVAVAGLDVAAARARVDSVRAGRRRVRRGTTLACVGVLAAVALGWGLQDRPDPDEVVADRGDSTTSTTTSTPTTTTPPVTAAPVEVTVAPVTAAPVAASTTTVAPATTLPSAPPPNQAMRVELRGPATVAAGDTVSLDVAWVDADHTGDAPAVSVDWADPEVATLPAEAPAARCDAPGGGGGGIVRASFRYATPGPKVVRVTVRSCGGQGAYAETVTASSTVEVTEPRLDGQPARVVVAVVPRTPDAAVSDLRLDDAVATVRAADPLVASIVRPPREPALAQFAASGPATVLVLPLAAQGALELTWPDSPCAASSEVVAAPAGSVSHAVLTRRC